MSEATRRSTRLARVAPEAELDRVRRWSGLARGGDVSEPLAALTALLDAAAREPGRAGVARTAAEAERGALDRSSLAWILRGVARGDGVQAHYGIGRGYAGRPGDQGRRGREAPGGHAVVGLAVRVGAVVTVGAKRGGEADWHYAAWMFPGKAWPELGAFSRATGGELTRPAQARLKAWHETVAPDRVRMDLGTARVVALAIFAEAFDGSDPWGLRGEA